LLGLLVASLAFSAMTGPVQAADPDAVKIGILNDQSGLYADFGGPTSVVVAQMAIEDFGGKVLGKPIELVSADHQNKPDAGAAIAVAIGA